MTISECQDTSPSVELFSFLDNVGSASAGQVGSESGEETLVRLVGEIILHCLCSNVSANGVSFTNVTSYMGLYIADEDSLGNVILKDSREVIDMESKDWLWRDTVAFASVTRDPVTGNFLPSQTYDVVRTHIDVRVKRKIQPREALILSVTNTRDTPAGVVITMPDIFIDANVRALMLTP